MQNYRQILTIALINLSKTMKNHSLVVFLSSLMHQPSIRFAIFANKRIHHEKNNTIIYRSNPNRDNR